MTTTKHTPRETAYGYGVLIRCGKTLVFVPAENDESMDAVDLIQAAPRLLEACRTFATMRRYYRGQCGQCGYEHERLLCDDQQFTTLCINCAIDKARAAIAKAEPIV